MELNAGTVVDKVWQSGLRSCIMYRLPTHLMQELNAGTVVDKVWQSGVRLCIITPGLPTHLVQELNAGTVVDKVWQSGVRLCIPHYAWAAHAFSAGIKCRHSS